jgi:serine O-acetyltransferase
MVFIELIKSDLKRYSQKSNLITLIKEYSVNPVFRYLFWFRFCSTFKTNKSLKYILCPIPYLILRKYQFKLGIHISTNIHVGKGLMIVHPGNIFINVKCIGENFTVYQGVTLGDNINYTGKKLKQLPTIKNNVVICTGSTVYGDIVLEDNSIVGCNSVVNKNVKEGTLVAGVPAKLIGKNI